MKTLNENNYFFSTGMKVVFYCV